MFSEYASRFLAQSQSRLSLGGAPNERHDPHTNRHNTTSPSSRPRPSNTAMNPHGSTRFAASRSYLRPNTQSPYGPSASQYSRFPLGSRAGGTAQAPLFYSATDEFREEDDGEEHEREVADFYALQKSRAHFAGSRLSESSEVEDDRAPESSLEQSGENDRQGSTIHGFGGGRGIKSSWRGETFSTRGRQKDVDRLEVPSERDSSRPASASSEPSSRGRGNLVNVDLESTIRDSIEELSKDDIPPDFEDDRPPVVQKFRNIPRSDHSPTPPQFGFTKPADEESARLYPRSDSPDRESVPADTPSVPMGSPKHDAFWATLFWISFAMFFATAFLIWLHTSVPSKIGDTIYSTLHKSFFQLAVYTIVAVFVSQVWLALLRYHAKKLIATILVAVPVILISFAIYTFVNSYKIAKADQSLQDEAMKWLATLPFGFAVIWVLVVYRSRHAFGKAIDILEFSCKILAEHPALLLVGFAHLAIFVAWTWIWLVLFARLFLTGHSLPRKNLFVISGSAWALGVYYVLMYLWTLGILSGMQRSITAATVSQWYFHRRSAQNPPSRAVVQASLSHATGPMYGTICLSTLLTLLGRLPLLILPRRLAGLFALAFYNLIPTPIAALTNPLALTYASIYSHPLGSAARSLTHMSFVSRLSPSSGAALFEPSSRDFRDPRTGSAARPLRQYGLAKLLLHATRYMSVLALGFGGWVSTARSLHLAGTGYAGSLYAYVVGLASGAIGWGVLGAIENILTGIVDALVVCWASETGGGATGPDGEANQARYCREAGELFGDERRASFF